MNTGENPRNKHPELAHLNHADDVFLFDDVMIAGWKSATGGEGVESYIQNRDWPSQADVAVLHGVKFNGVRHDGSYLRNPDVESRDGLVCVLLSREGLLDSPCRVRGEWGVRFVLSVRDPAQPILHVDAGADSHSVAAAAANWQELFEAVLRPGCLAAWFDRRDQEFEREQALLATLFGRIDRVVFQWEVATAILCQGYLAVLAATGDERAAAAIGGQIVGVQDTLSSEVTAPEWWKTALGEQMPAWATLPHSLMSAIYEERADGRGAIGTDVVVEAYTELCRRIR